MRGVANSGAGLYFAAEFARPGPEAASAGCVDALGLEVGIDVHSIVPMQEWGFGGRGFTSVSVGAVAPSVWTPGHVRGQGLRRLKCSALPAQSGHSTPESGEGSEVSGALGRVLVSCTHAMSRLQVAGLMFSGSCSTLLAVCPDMPASWPTAAQLILRDSFRTRTSFLIHSRSIVFPLRA